MLEDLSYADDICLVSHSHADMAPKLLGLTNEARIVGLKINIKKTKSIPIDTNNVAHFIIPYSLERG